MTLQDDDLERLALGLSQLAVGGKKAQPTDATVDALGALMDAVVRIGKLEQRIAALERAGPAVHHAGTWKEGKAFEAGSLCTHQGGLWLARSATAARPGHDHASWQLVVKAGHAGANGAEPRHVRTATRAAASYERPR